MIQTNSSYPCGTIGFTTANRPRFQDFYDALENTLVPSQTQLIRASNYNAAHNRNELIDTMEGDWIWLLDDDHCWEPSALMRLLKHDVDIVVPVYCRRYPPFKPTIFKTFRPPELSESYTWAELSKLDGLIPVEAAGCGGMLVKRRALEKMEQPYFRVGASNGPEFDFVEKDYMLEDQGFCYRAIKAGLKVYCDLNVSIAHIRESMLVAQRQPDGAFSVYNDLSGAADRFSIWLFKGQ